MIIENSWMSSYNEAQLHFQPFRIKLWIITVYGSIFANNDDANNYND